VVANAAPISARLAVANAAPISARRDAAVVQIYCVDPYIRIRTM
jgi:hypothetical protein